MSQSFAKAQPGPVQKLIAPPEQPDLPGAPEKLEEVTALTDDAGRAKQRKKRRLARGGVQSTVLAGIKSALNVRLKQRLGT